jgi:hypothetical protein
MVNSVKLVPESRANLESMVAIPEERLEKRRKRGKKGKKKGFSNLLRQKIGAMIKMAISEGSNHTQTGRQKLNI